MKRVYKFPIPVVSSPHALELPVDATLVHARMSLEGDPVYLWYEVDSEKPVRSRRFEIFPTGVDVPGSRHHVVTVSAADLRLVWHVYELEESFGG